MALLQNKTYLIKYNIDIVTNEGHNNYYKTHTNIIRIIIQINITCIMLKNVEIYFWQNYKGYLAP